MDGRSEAGSGGVESRGQPQGDAAHAAGVLLGQDHAGTIEAEWRRRRVSPRRHRPEPAQTRQTHPATDAGDRLKRE